MERIIRTILVEWRNRKLPSIVEREVKLNSYLDLPIKKIIAVTGMRRVGKTYILFGLINKLLKKHSREEVIYLNFEDERISLKTSFLTKLVPVIKETFGKLPKYLFLDEIQNIPNWSKWLRRTLEQQDFHLFVTGSSSKLSSHEIPTELRGRSLEVKVFPLSFKEYLKFNGLVYNKKLLDSDDNKKAELKFQLEKFLVWGGMPEVALVEEAKKMELLQQYYTSILKRDIVERYKIKNEELISELGRLLVNSTTFSVSKTHNFLKGISVNVGKGTIAQYFKYLEESFFLSAAPIFSYKVKDQMQYPRKIYVIDNGFISALGLNFSKNRGRLFENAVHANLKRELKENENIYYWKNQRGREVDLVMKKANKIAKLVQVCSDLSLPEVRNRETKALVAAARELKTDDLTIVTGDEEREEKIGRKYKIKYLPLWKWLLFGFGE